MTDPTAHRPGRTAVVLLLARRGLRDLRVRTVVFGYLYAIYAYIQPAGYRHAYASAAEANSRMWASVR